MKKIIALLLILAMLFSVAACKSADEEEGATAGELVTENENEQPENNQNTQENQNGQQEQNTTPPAQEQNKNEQTEPEKEQETPPLSESGKYKVTFNLGFDNQTQTENTDGKVTEFTPERAGYKFDGWYDGETKFDFSKEITGDIKLTAKWSLETYTVTYVGDNLPSGNPTSYTVPQNDIKLTAPELLFKKFNGWEISNGQKTVTAYAIPAGMTGNLTVKPVFDETTFVLGKYEQDGNTENGEEPVCWKKLKEDGGKTLYVAECILDAKPWDTKGAEDTQWAQSSLRQWLNSSFYRDAFSDTERALIVKTTNKTEDTFNGRVSDDYVFILSIAETKETMASAPEKQALVTKQAEKNGATVGKDGNGWWWVRDKVGPYGVGTVEDLGHTRFERSLGYDMKLTTFGVRPAIWVDNSKIK